MPEVRVGPLLRHVGETDATIWVETDKPCRVEILGHSADTFEVEGHHFAIVCVEGLDPDTVHPYEVHLDGDRAWPPDDYEFPKPRVRLMPRSGNLRLLFGSCRASAPHHPPYTFQGWWHPKGKGIDVLRAYGMRMLRQPRGAVAGRDDADGRPALRRSSARHRRENRRWPRGPR